VQKTRSVFPKLRWIYFLVELKLEEVKRYKKLTVFASTAQRIVIVEKINVATIF